MNDSSCVLREAAEDANALPGTHGTKNTTITEHAHKKTVHGQGRHKMKTYKVARYEVTGWMNRGRRCSQGTET